jgi:outer membrane protein
MRFALPLVALALAVQTAHAQTAGLTLDEAISLARRNNPLFQQTVNARRSADGQLRGAYASLLPSVSANMSGRYQQSGNQFVSGVSLGNASDVVQSSYGLGINYTINSAVLFAPKLYKAQRDAAEADVNGAAELLRSAVTQQYLAVLQAQARAAVQDTLMQTSKGQLELAKAKQSVGAATILDIRRAEVALGQSEVASLQQHNLAEVEKLRLFEQLGVAQPEGIDLTTRFPITPVNFKLDSLKDLARRSNPGMQALRQRETSANAGVHARQGQYLPTINLSTGWGGNSSAFTNDAAAVAQARGSVEGRREACFSEDSLRSAVAGMARLNCASLPTWSPTLESQALENNSKFPFKFTRAPMSFSAFVSLPIFDNLNRETNLQNAMIQRDDAKLRTRAGELALTANVTQAYLNLLTAIRTNELQEVNAARAREELSFAEERYKVGAATFLDVTTSRGTYEQAQIDRVNAIYDYHKAFAALENAVGRPLR